MTWVEDASGLLPELAQYAADLAAVDVHAAAADAEQTQSYARLAGRLG